MPPRVHVLLEDWSPYHTDDPIYRPMWAGSLRHKFAPDGDWAYLVAFPKHARSAHAVQQHSFYQFSAKRRPLDANRPWPIDYRCRFATAQYLALCALRSTGVT